MACRPVRVRAFPLPREGSVLRPPLSLETPGSGPHLLLPGSGRSAEALQACPGVLETRSLLSVGRRKSCGTLSGRACAARVGDAAAPLLVEEVSLGSLGVQDEAWASDGASVAMKSTPQPDLLGSRNRRQRTPCSSRREPGSAPLGQGKRRLGHGPALSWSWASRSSRGGAAALLRRAWGCVCSRGQHLGLELGPHSPCPLLLRAQPPPAWTCLHVCHHGNRGRVPLSE